MFEIVELLLACQIWVHNPNADDPEAADLADSVNGRIEAEPRRMASPAFRVTWRITMYVAGPDTIFAVATSSPGERSTRRCLTRREDLSQLPI